MTSEQPKDTSGEGASQADQAGPGDHASTVPLGQTLEIRKYPNRRLYDATRSRHVTLDELYELVAAGHTLQVRDSKTGEDLTNQILLQALIERDPLKITAVPTPLIHMMIRVNSHLIASWFDMGLSQVFQAYRAAAAGTSPGWPPAAPGMGWPGTWGPGAASPGGGMPWANPFVGQSPVGAAGPPASPLGWMQAMQEMMAHAPGVGAPGAARGVRDEAPPTDVSEPADLETLRKQVAQLAAELERLKSSTED